MKISKKSKNKIRKRLIAKMEKAMQERIKATAKRKSSEPEFENQEFDSNDKEQMAKFYRGALTGDWRSANAQYKLYKRLNKAQAEGLGTTGGFLVPPEQDRTLIEYIRAKTVVRGMPGIRTYNMKSNILEMPRMDSGATASWGAENTAITSSAVNFGQVQMILRKCVGLVRISNELIEDADPSIVDMINRDLTEEVAKRVDIGLLEGTGGDQPLGIYYQPRINWTDLGSSPDFDDFYDALYQVRLHNHEVNAWVSHPRLENTLLKLRTGDSQYLRPYVEGVSGNEPRLPRLMGLPIYYTTNIPITGRDSTDDSYCIGADWSQIIIGDHNGLRLEASREDRFEYDQTTVRAVYRVGIMLRHPEAVVLIKGIDA